MFIGMSQDSGVFVGHSLGAPAPSALTHVSAERSALRAPARAGRLVSGTRRHPRLVALALVVAVLLGDRVWVSALFKVFGGCGDCGRVRVVLGWVIDAASHYRRLPRLLQCS